MIKELGNINEVIQLRYAFCLRLSNAKPGAKFVFLSFGLVKMSCCPILYPQLIRKDFSSSLPLLRKTTQVRVLPLSSNWKQKPEESETIVELINLSRFSTRYNDQFQQFIISSIIRSFLHESSLHIFNENFGYTSHDII